jgi:hypothetical protein
MDMLKLRTSTVVDKAMGFKAVDNALRADAEHADQSQMENETTPAISNNVLTADRVSMYVRVISKHSTDEIDALINDLRGLRQKLVHDGSRIEQDVMDFAAFNQSVIKLTEAVSEGVAQVKTDQPQ